MDRTNSSSNNYHGSNNYKRHTMTEEQIKERQVETAERAEKIREYIKEMNSEKLFIERKCPIANALIDSGKVLV